MSMGKSIDELDVVVVGGGQAGVMLSYYLGQRDVDHLVLERDRPFSAWKDRWDGFRTNTPNWMNTLPVLPKELVPSNDPLVFGTGDEMVEYLDMCLAAVAPPLQTGTNVQRISRASDIWEVETDDVTYRSKCVAMCNGAMSKPTTPAAARAIPQSVAQIHSSEYRHPEQIKTGSVLVVGSASSGVQICRLLCESERFEQIHMSVSKVTVLPEKILGVQTHRFIHALGLFDVRSRSMIGRLMYSNLENRGDPIMRPTPEDLAKTHGVQLFSRFEGVEGSSLIFRDGQSLSMDDLTIVWCTGFRGDYSMLDESVDVLNGNGAPVHDRGVARAAPGLFFVGLRHQHTVASHDIYGVAKDADYVADRIVDRLALLGTTTTSDSHFPENPRKHG